MIRYVDSVPSTCASWTDWIPGEPTCFVKYGDEDALVEAKTRMYFYDLAQQDDSAPRIPKVYDVFNE